MLRSPKNPISLQQLWAFCAALLVSSCAAKPPHETGEFRASELVELQRLDPTIKLDIRYATSQNFAGRPVYSEARAFLQRPAAEALVRVNKELEPPGLPAAGIRWLPALERHQAILGHHAQGEERICGEPEKRLAPQPRLRRGFEPLRSCFRQRSGNARCLRRNE
jgi:hypothetical protein